MCISQASDGFQSYTAVGRWINFRDLSDRPILDIPASEACDSMEVRGKKSIPFAPSDVLLVRDPLNAARDPKARLNIELQLAVCAPNLIQELPHRATAEQMDSSPGHSIFDYDPRRCRLGIEPAARHRFRAPVS
jgi:hypothetical protein